MQCELVDVQGAGEATFMSHDTWDMQEWHQPAGHSLEEVKQVPSLSACTHCSMVAHQRGKGQQQVQRSQAQEFY